MDASYTVRLTKEKNELPREEQERITRHLPMCDSVLLHKGDHCSLRESVIFARSDYSWMRKYLAAGRPDLHPLIAEEGKRIAAGTAAK